MKLLCASNSMAFSQSLRIALEAEDIETFCSDPDFALGSIAGQVAGGGGRVYVLHEADWARAVEILSDLSGSSAPAAGPSVSTRAGPSIPKWLLISIAALGTLVLAAAMGGQ